MRNVSSKINLIGDIIGKLKQIKAGFSKVTEEARKATGQTTKLQSVCDKLNMTNLSATLDVFDKLGSHIESATEASMSFGQAMADLSSITGITGAELEELSAQSRKFGKESGLGADTAARAYSLLASQIDVAEIGIEGLNILQ